MQKYSISMQFLAALSKQYTAVAFREISSTALMKLLLDTEIHVAVCRLQATHRPTIAGLLLQSCFIEVSLLGGVWNNSGGTPADVHLDGNTVCVCVFFPFILDIKFVGRTSRGHTGGRSHRISHLPSFCGACLNFSRERDSAIPFPRRP